MNDQHQADRSGAPHTDDLNRRQVIEDFSDVMDTISRLMVQIFARHLAPEGITVLQYHALRAISTSGPEMDMSSISTMTGLPASSITGILDRLEKLGLVERQHDSADRRRVVATITPDGAALMQRIMQQEVDRLDHVLSKSSSEDLAVCLKVFQNVEERMHELYDT